MIFGGSVTCDFLKMRCHKMTQGWLDDCCDLPNTLFLSQRYHFSSIKVLNEKILCLICIFWAVILHHPHYLTLLMTSEMAEITPDKERRVEEEVVDGRQDQQRRISQQGLRECFSPPTSSVVMFRIQEDLFFERRIWSIIPRSNMISLEWIDVW